MKVLYEDNHLIVAVKPQNIPTQADSSGDVDFLSHIKQYVQVKYHKPGAAYIGMVHRLDRPAGGVMVFARTSKAAARLSDQMKKGIFQKQYFAVVQGDIPQSQELVHYLRKDRQMNTTKVVNEDTPGAKRAALSYRTEQEQNGMKLVEVNLQTGRSHQIRVQMSRIAAPLVGDYRYGGAKNGTLCLWSYLVGFEHPTTKENLIFTCLPPDEHPWKLFEFGKYS